jgi:hypothetical protein
MLSTFERTESEFYRDPAGIVHRVVTGGEIAVVRSGGYLGLPDRPAGAPPVEFEPLLAIVPLTDRVLAALGLPRLGSA